MHDSFATAVFPLAASEALGVGLRLRRLLMLFMRAGDGPPSRYAAKRGWFLRYSRLEAKAPTVT